ncbi:hypothetical protein EN827_01900 [Mesorhizobium sp. M1D.F.Ca.ET.184.01.1.1]|nr:hypothetical protein EN874_001900 [Mesorhizobium sp. M1D.F.Ca.ET.231.01.1.1]TGP38410.1 hypothetical protein EN877_01900 [Mesorhizobium sp. M1D.F.Ca.ET.234.01.1.1]TGS50620.1 hypothetical protein EN827_01900 [Mesorhizobium sp. M1D.F.Ca.ET.184.01.1.1]TGS66505.1 hypothetical protein EN826_001900 [Mesorhizobium sp. M1D.F.Ca.ET.183.01.1.1]
MTVPTAATIRTADEQTHGRIGQSVSSFHGTAKRSISLFLREFRTENRCVLFLELLWIVHWSSGLWKVMAGGARQPPGIFRDAKLRSTSAV